MQWTSMLAIYFLFFVFSAFCSPFIPPSIPPSAVHNSDHGGLKLMHS